MSDAVPWRAVEGGVKLSLRLTPKAGRDGIDGIGELSDGRSVLLVRVRAVPKKGAANKALLEKMLAKALKAPERDVSVEAGHTARIKTVLLTGDKAELCHALEALTQPGAG
ncbi:DUF167 family protein [Breoghania sp.]|uniref:DUF167 family protein n=1 Tax=Breoghania sp. TaxID=2065378 RepID=UPI00263017F6|nr:DUF167 family protein [Breoghania sp.]MDJ0930616.1 DUF167 family protein [Breoghania sp.]